MTITTWWRATTPASTEPAALIAENTELRRKLTAAQKLQILTACELDGLKIEHKDLLTAYEELAARYREIASPTVPEDEPETALRIRVQPLWHAFPPMRPAA